MDQHHSPEGEEPGVRDSSAAARWSRVREILHEALQMDVDLRADYPGLRLRWGRRTAIRG